MAKYRSVLSVAGAPRLLASALVGRLPQGMASLAILLLVRGSTGSYAAAGFAVGAYAFANAACSPAQGRLVDRYGRVRVLLPLAAAQAGGTARACGAHRWPAATAGCRRWWWPARPR